MRGVLCFLACLHAAQLNADYTYVWAGNDPRFSGSFSVSDTAFALRSFTSLTAVNFRFQDSLSPINNLTLDSPLGLYAGNDIGMITGDGQHLSHNVSPSNPNAAFWVAVWQYPGIEVGMYTYNTGDSVEHFKYVDYNRGVFVESTGNWSLQSVPEPSSDWLVGIGSCLALAWAFTHRQQKT